MRYFIYVLLYLMMKINGIYILKCLIVNIKFGEFLS